MLSQTETLSVVPSNVRLHDSWKALLQAEFQKPHMKLLKDFLVQEKKQGKTIYPKGDEIFLALNRTPVDRVKVVILGQDPYHGPGQAHGLSFSVPRGTKLPPSLLNIYKELETDLGIPVTRNGCLETWADQGVLLLNSVLTVQDGQAASHQNKGWEKFTDQIIQQVNDHVPHVAFILWGAYAQKKASFVDRNRHFVLQSPHPSPLSAHRGFFGSRPFSKVNQFLVEKNLLPIDWKVP